MDSKTYIDQLYANRELLVKQTKNPYQSPNWAHRKIFWGRIYLANKLISKYVKNFDSVLDFGTHEGVIIPSLLSIFHKVYSLELIEERTAKDNKGRTQQELIGQMIEHFKLDKSKIVNVDITPEDQELKMLSDKSLDLIVATDVLEHVPNLPTLMATFKRILRPEGIMVISIPTENFLYQAGVWLNNLIFKMGTDRHFHINEAADIEKLLRENFEVLKTHNHFTFFKFFVVRNRS